VACETETPTTARVQNGYDGAVVYQVWYASTLFGDAIASGDSSEEERTVPGSDYVYALLAPGWDSASSLPPSRLLALRSKGKLDVMRGDVGLIVVSPRTFDGDCGAGGKLDQEAADLVTQRIFPGPFAGARYDADACLAVPIADSGGPDAAVE
jgi:hypothetical protein